MKRALLICVMFAAALSAGCETARYRSQPLAQVPYAKAYQEAQAVFAQYFPIASADPATGEIVGRPTPARVGPGRIISATPARKLARLRIREKSGVVVAEVRVQLQRQEADVYRAVRPITVDTEHPAHDAMADQALSPEQQQAWTTIGRDHALERAILADLLNRLTPKK